MLGETNNGLSTDNTSLSGNKKRERRVSATDDKDTEKKDKIRFNQENL